MGALDDLLVPQTPLPAVELSQRFRGVVGPTRTRGRYWIVNDVTCAPPEECFAALPLQPPMNPPAPSLDHPLFVRVVRRDRLAADVAQRIRVADRGLEGIFEVAEEPPNDALIVSRFIYGASVRALGEAVARRRQRMPWSLVLAIYAQAKAALAAFAASGLAHGALTASRVRLDLDRLRTVVCHVLTAGEPLRPDSIELARIVLPLAAKGRELELVNALEAEDDLVVLRDHLVEQERANEERVLATFADVGDSPVLPESALTMLWTWVAGCSRVGII